MAAKSIVFITGANTGLGFEAVKALYASPKAYTILLGSRSLDKAKTAISTLQSEISESKSEVIPVQIDIESDSSIESAYKEIESKWGRLDSLVNNAGAAHGGILKDRKGIDAVREAWNHDWSLNVASTQVCTHQFIPLLLKSSNPYLLFITSGLSSLAVISKGGSAKTETAPPPKGWPKPYQPSFVGYRSSKAGLNMMMLDWARILKPDGVKVFCISPGFLATGLGGIGVDNMKKAGALDPSTGGTLIQKVLEGERDEDAGKIVAQQGLLPW